MDVPVRVNTVPDSEPDPGTNLPSAHTAKSATGRNHVPARSGSAPSHPGEYNSPLQLLAWIVGTKNFAPSASTPAFSEAIPDTKSRRGMYNENMSQSEQLEDSSLTLELLQSWQAGDQSAGEKLFPMVFQELREIAAGLLRNERADHTLQPTALVNELYMKMVGMRDLEFEDRVHFLSMSARAMRQILVDYARARQAAKRGGDWIRTEIDNQLGISEKPVDVLALEEALQQLNSIDPKRVQFVELRFFAGMTVEETARAMAISRSTAKRHWLATKAWLNDYFSRQAPGFAS